MADEPRGFNPGWTDPLEPGRDPVAVGSQEPTPSYGVPLGELPPPIKGDDGLKVYFEAGAYVIRMNLDEAETTTSDQPGLWTPVWRQGDGRFLRVDFSALFTRIQNIYGEFNGVIQAGLTSIQNTLTGRQNTYEGTQTAARQAYEQSQTTARTTFEAAQVAARTAFESKESTARGTFETAQATARQAFETAQNSAFQAFTSQEETARETWSGTESAARAQFAAEQVTARQAFEAAQVTARQTFESAQNTLRSNFQTSETAARTAFQTAQTEARTAHEAATTQRLATQDNAILDLQGAWTSYQGTLTGRMDGLEQSTASTLSGYQNTLTTTLSGFDARITDAEGDAAEALSKINQAVAGMIADGSITPAKLSQETLDLIGSGGGGGVPDDASVSVPKLAADVVNWFNAKLDAFNSVMRGNPSVTNGAYPAAITLHNPGSDTSEGMIWPIAAINLMTRSGENHDLYMGHADARGWSIGARGAQNPYEPSKFMFTFWNGATWTEALQIYEDGRLALLRRPTFNGSVPWDNSNLDPTVFATWGHRHHWDDLDGKPDSYWPSVHTHSWESITGKPLSFPATAHTHLWGDITDKPASFTPSAHSHAYSSLTGIPTTFAPSAHSHAYADITGKPTTFAPSAHTHLWADLTDKPTTFPPAAHTHSYNDLTDKPTIPAGRMDFVVYAAGKPGAGEVLLRFVSHLAWTLPAGLALSRASAGVAGTTNGTAVIVAKNGTQVGTIMFAAGSTTGTMTAASATSFAVGDVLTLTMSSPQNATLADVSVTLAGTR